MISIHTLRMEGDAVYVGTEADAKVISIHTLRMEGDGTFRKASVATM